jgi:GWxTD domain-containing protein
MTRICYALLAAGLLAGCGSWSRVGSEDERPAGEQLTDILDTRALYDRIGRLSADEPLPFIGEVAFAASTGDSVLALIGLSLQNRALSFQREGDGFVARYHVEINFAPAAGAPVTLRRDEVVRVASFPETQRSDESIIFQQAFSLTPGTYELSVSLRDPASGNSSSAKKSVEAPDFAPGTTTAPILVYEARGRGQLDDTLALVLNPRGSVLFGADTLLAYIEGYAFPGPASVPVEIRDERDSVILREQLRFQGGSPVESQVLKFRPDSTALGVLRVAIGSGPTEQSSTALVSFSHAWVVTNYIEMTQLLRYFGEDRMLDSIRNASAAQRPELWSVFWRETDPDPSTPENEAINNYFARLTIANQRFRGEGVPGWRTDRGEVYITLGEPDESFENSPGQVGGRVLRWNYLGLRASFFFVDETSFGRFRLTPSSRSELERIRARLRRMAE